MAFLCETPDRRVIPNWRSLSDTISNGELEYPQYDEKKYLIYSNMSKNGIKISLYYMQVSL